MFTSSYLSFLSRLRQGFQLELHIGYVYGSSETPPHASHYKPKWIAGARLPHAWITIPETSMLTSQPRAVDVSYVTEFSADMVAQYRFTTLDLCAPDAFTFIVSKSDQWDQVIGSVRLHYETCGLRIAVLRLEDDFRLIPGKNGDVWVNGAGLKRDGGVIVRPDQHILAPLEPGVTVEEILGVFARHLGI